MNVDHKSFSQNGFLLLKDFFAKEEVRLIRNEGMEVFKNILFNEGFIEEKSICEEGFNEALFRLFKTNLKSLQNAGKQIQHLISLHRLALDSRIERLLNSLNLKFPNISTRPVLFFNHPKLAMERVYHTMDAHQDWRSMQGSLNSIVIWVPLMDIDKKVGALKVLPGSHKQGLVGGNFEKGFGFSKLTTEELNKMISIEVREGDILVFSSFLIHASGDNTTNSPRWSCHFRYNDLNEESFIERGYPHAYIYKPQEKLITPGFPTIHDLERTFNN